MLAPFHVLAAIVVPLVLAEPPAPGDAVGVVVGLVARRRSEWARPGRTATGSRG